jgi:hypothetical protein
MATVLLQSAGTALGSVFGPFGAILGRAVGGLAGAALDQSLFGKTSNATAPSLSGVRISSADEGTPIARVYGTMRVAGSLIWATRFEEEVTVERRGGKATSRPKQTVETKSYYANFAIGLCEGPIQNIKRVWADGREVDLSQIDMRIYYGSDDQLPDPLIEAKQGAGKTPSYRGLAYVVFDRMPIENYGNRIPVLHFEVTRVVGALENDVRAVTLIPGATEHGLATRQISERIGSGEKRFLNHNITYAPNDLQASLNELQQLCPNLKSVGLVVAWFGSDLRAGHCTLRPGVEVRSRAEESRVWKVGGVNRSVAHLISRQNNSPVYGGTPDDASVVDAIIELKSRGLKVTLYPFILMDVPEGNSLPSPYDGSSQPVYPWRGRITCYPAIGESGSADQTADGASQIASFTGTSSAENFSISGSGVNWLGGDQRYRHMILHYAHLAKAAGGVDGFVIGSEMVALTKVRDDGNGFPFVDDLKILAQDCRNVMGANTKLTYAADWSEYFGYHPQDGSGDVYFHLDDLWAHPAIDAVGIDNYMPLSDWRDEDLSAANPDGFRIQNDVTALQGQIEGGEGFDWYYANNADRKKRVRTTITDGSGKPWVYRYKDLRSWWQNDHYNRIGGIEVGSKTAWNPQVKPIWFTEFGCPAVDKGSNQPNVFPDPKSSENAFPYFSSKNRDDLAQRAYLKAHLEHWSGSANSPRMIDLDNSYIWTWDARPSPAFPENLGIWSDGINWRTGHWVNGRLGTAPIGELIAAILSDHGFFKYDVSRVEGVITGFIQNEPTSARNILEPLLNLYQIDVSESQDGLVFTTRTRKSQKPAIIKALVDNAQNPLMSHKRAQESELANEVHINSVAPEQEYTPSTAYSRRLSRGSQRHERLALSGAIEAQSAGVLADQWLQDHWASQESVEFTLPISEAQLEIGDRLVFEAPADFLAPKGQYDITQIEDEKKRTVSAKRVVSGIASSEEATSSPAKSSDVSAAFSPDIEFLDLPIISGDDASNWARAAGYAKPWVPITLSSSVSTSGFTPRVNLISPATIGKLATDLLNGAEGRWDYKNKIIVDLPFGELQSVTTEQLLAGANIAAIQSNSGVYEIIQFEEALEIASHQWQLSKLLRGQVGTEDASESGAIVGARFVLINDAVTSLGLNTGEMANVLNWQIFAASRASESIPLIPFAGGERANTPLSPAHIRAKRIDSGIMFDWIRRSRYNADSWLGTDVPLDEDELTFRIDICSSGSIIRSVDVSGTSYLYEAADEITDFGVNQTQIEVEIRQLGGYIASGVARKAILSL